jgi:callose synthase
MLLNNLRILASLALRLTLKASAACLLATSYRTLTLEHPFDSLVGVRVGEWYTRCLLPNRLFCYVSLAYLVPVLFSTSCQIWPALSTWVRGWRGTPKALVDTLDPLNRLLVGKAIHTSLAAKLPYDFFWLSLLTLKFAFSYAFQIAPLVEPTLDLWALDLSGWAPGTHLGKWPNMLVLLVRWTPLMIMYMIDLQLWFMLWTAMYGTVIGCKMHIGEVPDMPTVRARFLAAAANFNRKVVSAEACLERVDEKPYALPDFAQPSPSLAAESSSSSSSASASIGAAVTDGMRLAALRASLLPPGSSHHAESGEIRNESLRYFAEAWNAILHDMRASDLLSDRELRLLVFRCWRGGGSIFSRCTYLPVFSTAGKLHALFHTLHSLAAEAHEAAPTRQLAIERSLHCETLADDVETVEAAVEFVELTQWILCGLLGERHAPACHRVIAHLRSIVERGEFLRVLTPAALPGLVKAVVALATLLKGVPLAPTGGGGDPAAPAAEWWKGGGGGDGGGGDGDAPAPAPASAAARLPASFSTSKIVDAVKTALDTLCACIGKAPKPLISELEVIKFTSNGFFWDDSYAKETIGRLRAEEQCAEKCDGLLTLCTTAQIDTTPAEFEVNRRLCWFVGSLFMKIPRPPPVASMGSWTTLTPFYSEDLLYSAKELAAKTEDGVSMLLFLKTVHENEWNNFLERLGVDATPEGEARLFTEKPLLEELRLWASFRGQTLARTVEGMMLHERALRLLASWEGLRDRELDETVAQKFSYVVSCQAYGQHKKSRDLKAADTEFLLQRYPSLRVAYVDRAPSLTKVVDEGTGRTSLREATRFYSVLIKGVKHEVGGPAPPPPGPRAERAEVRWRRVSRRSSACSCRAT